MEEEDVDDHLWEYDNEGKRKVIRQLSLSNGVALGDFGLLCKEDNVNEDKRHSQHGLGVA